MVTGCFFLFDKRSSYSALWDGRRVTAPLSPVASVVAGHAFLMRVSRRSTAHALLIALHLDPAATGRVIGAPQRQHDADRHRRVTHDYTCIHHIRHTHALSYQLEFNGSSFSRSILATSSRKTVPWNLSYRLYSIRRGNRRQQVSPTVRKPRCVHISTQPCIPLGSLNRVPALIG